MSCFYRKFTFIYAKHTPRCHLQIINKVYYVIYKLQWLV